MEDTICAVRTTHPPAQERRYQLNPYFLLQEARKISRMGYPSSTRHAGSPFDRTAAASIGQIVFTIQTLPAVEELRRKSMSRVDALSITSPIRPLPLFRKRKKKSSGRILFSDSRSSLGVGWFLIGCRLDPAIRHQTAKLISVTRWLFGPRSSPFQKNSPQPV